MTRLEPVPGPEGLDETQRALWDNVVSGRRARAGTQTPKYLRGPFNPWMYAAGGGVHAARLGEYIRYESTLPDQIREIAILTVASRFHTEFEFWAHSHEARAAGLPEEIIEAIRCGQNPLGGGPEEFAAVYAGVRQLLDNCRIEDATAKQISDLLGDRGLVELVMLTGYYSLVSMTLNTFDVSAPSHIASYWPDA